MSLNLRYQIVIAGKDGEVKFDTGPMPCHSWTKQMAQAWSHALSGTDIPATEQWRSHTDVLEELDISQPIRLFGQTKQDNDETGIRCGTGSTAATKDDFQLEAIIADGSASGELTHNDQINYQGVLGTSTGFTALGERVFQNDSGATITVNEVGVQIFVDVDLSASTSRDHFLIIRDVLSTGVAVLDTESILVRYFYDWDV